MAHQDKRSMFILLLLVLFAPNTFAAPKRQHTSLKGGASQGKVPDRAVPKLAKMQTRRLEEAADPADRNNAPTIQHKYHFDDDFFDDDGFDDDEEYKDFIVKWNKRHSDDPFDRHKYHFDDDFYDDDGFDDDEEFAWFIVKWLNRGNTFKPTAQPAPAPAPAAVPAAAPAVQEIEDGWCAQTDQGTGRKFWWHPTTGRTTWEPPLAKPGQPAAGGPGPGPPPAQGGALGDAPPGMSAPGGYGASGPPGARYSGEKRDRGAGFSGPSMGGGTHQANKQARGSITESWDNFQRTGRR
mmetsp:Transcript_18424/g.42044  ORF Transcript_18424/g.42044 Transcript_18424/m.42044 type:complete len:295 (+) Transcript_18424:195-1079(+)